jgi:hypothetical protein
MDVTFGGKPVVVDERGVTLEGDPDGSVRLTAMAERLIGRGEVVSIDCVTWPWVPASWADDYSRVATLFEAARRTGTIGLALVGVETDPAVVY